MIKRSNWVSETNILPIWYAIFAAWGTDTCAYCIGIPFGKHKLCPISPKKSVEGAIGGVLGAVAIVLIYTVIMNNLYNLGYSYLYISFVTIILSIIGQIGDFAASSIKRYVDVKDYSNLIPGHGGVLDRFDSSIYSTLVFYIILIV